MAKKELQFTEYTSRPQILHIKSVGSKPKKRKSIKDTLVTAGLCAMVVGFAVTMILIGAYLGA